MGILTISSFVLEPTASKYDRDHQLKIIWTFACKLWDEFLF